MQVRVTLDHARFAPELDPLACAVIDEKQIGFRIIGKIALRDVLAVAGKIGKGDRMVVEHMQETRRAAAMLDIGLAIAVGRGKEHADLALR